MKITQIIEQLRSIVPVTNLQKEALAWSVATLLHRQKEIDRGPHEQKSAKKAKDTKSRTDNKVPSDTNRERFQTAIRAAHSRVNAGVHRRVKRGVE